MLLLETVKGTSSLFGFSRSNLATENAFDKHPLGGVVKEKIGKQNKFFFSGIETVWDEEYCDWPPSMDSLFIGSLILKNEFLRNILEDAESFAEIGCGTAFISTLVCSKYSIHELFLSDIRAETLDIAKFNVSKNRKNQKIFALRGSGLKPFLLLNRKIDVVFANPPYIIVEDESFETDSPTKTTGLLEELLIDVWQYASCLILEYSSCSLERLQKIHHIHQQREFEVKERVIDIKIIPFRVYNVNAEDLKKLLDRKLLIDLENNEDRKEYPSLCKDNRGFRFWHKIILSVFSKG